MLVAEYGNDVIATYQIDASGNPIPASRAVFVSGLTGAEGSVIDPMTGDFLFSTFGGTNQVIVVQGFAPPPTNTPRGSPNEHADEYPGPSNGDADTHSRGRRRGADPVVPDAGALRPDAGRRRVPPDATLSSQGADPPKPSALNRGMFARSLSLNHAPVAVAVAVAVAGAWRREQILRFAQNDERDLAPSVPAPVAAREVSRSNRGRRRAPRERSAREGSGERSRPHPAESLAGAPKAQIPPSRVATCGAPGAIRTRDL